MPTSKKGAPPAGDKPKSKGTSKDAKPVAASHSAQTKPKPKGK